MPRTYPPRRSHVAFRIAPAGLEAVERIAAEECGGDRSEALRKLIGEALATRDSKPRRRSVPTPQPTVAAVDDAPPVASDEPA